MPTTFTNSWYPNTSSFTAPNDGNVWQAALTRNGAQGEAGYDNPTTLDGYYVYAPGQTKPGQTYQFYDPAGNHVRNGAFQEVNATRDFMTALAAALTMGFGAPAMMGAEAAAGAGGTAAGVAGLPAGAEASLFWDMGAAPGAAGVGGAGAAGGGAAAAGAGGSSLLNTLAPNGVSSLLGPAASLLGAAAGSQGQKNSETTQRDIQEWLKPYVLGQGGLLDSARNVFQQQAGNQAGWQAMQDKAMGLLSQPVAGNGYSMFSAQPRFGR